MVPLSIANGTAMTTDSITLSRDHPAASGRAVSAVRPDDKSMLKAAADLTRDLNRASPAI